VTGRTHAWYIAIVDRRPIIVGPIKRDEALIADPVAKAEMFCPTSGHNALRDRNTHPPPERIAAALLRGQWPDAVAAQLMPEEAEAGVKRSRAERDRGGGPDCQQRKASRTMCCAQPGGVARNEQRCEMRG